MHQIENNLSSKSIAATDSGEYVDIIDVVGFLSRSKMWLASGILAGLLGAGFLFTTKMSPTYFTSVPLTNEGVVKAFAASDLQSLFDRSEFKSAFAARYAARSGGKILVEGSLPFKVLASGANLILEIASKSSDPLGSRALEITNDLSLSVTEYNKNEKAHFDAQNAGVMPVLKTDLEVTFTKVVALQSAEESPYRVKLFAMEAMLSQRAGMRPIPATAVLGSSMGDDVLRLLGAVGGKISPEERTKLLTEYGLISGAIKAIQAKYELPIKDLSSRFAPLSAGLIAAANGPMPVYVPVIDDVAFKASVAAGLHERKETKLPFILAIGLILGALFGLMAYGTKIFIEDNRDRLKAALNSK